MGADILRFSTACYVALAALVIVFAPSLAHLFVDDPTAVARSTMFIRIGALAAVGLGIDGSATGVLRGGGDTSWTFYATLVGMYVVALPLAYASIATDLGIGALYAALVLETFVPAAIMLKRYVSGLWLDPGSVSE